MGGDISPRTGVVAVAAAGRGASVRELQSGFVVRTGARRPTTPTPAQPRDVAMAPLHRGRQPDREPTLGA